MNQTVQEFDLRKLPASHHHATVCEAFDALAMGESIHFVANGSPWPIYDQFCTTQPDIFRWTTSIWGPPEWKVVITRLPSKETETRISAYFARDHGEIDAMMGFLREEQRLGTSQAALAAMFSEFNVRLERHIRWEEEILFPAVERRSPMLAMGPGPVMRMEHEDIRRYKAIAAKYLRDAPFTSDGRRRVGEMLDHVAEVLAGHNLKEEKVYYPISDEIFPPEEAESILRRVRAHH